MASQLNARQSPEMITDMLPPKRGTRFGNGFWTPAYNYGWIMPMRNLVKSLQDEDLLINEYSPMNVECRGIIPKWRGKYEERFGKYRRPCLRGIGPDWDLVLIYIANNDTVEGMEQAVKDKEYIEACLNCLNHPEDIKDLPLAWFRSAIKDTPEGYKKYDPNPYYL